jgi:hypothetical protein
MYKLLDGNHDLLLLKLESTLHHDATLFYKLQRSMFNGSYKLAMTLHLLKIHEHPVERFIAKLVTPIT